MQVLSANDVSKLTAEVGQKMDPNQHEAMFDVPNPDAEPGSIAIIVKVCHLTGTCPQCRMPSAPDLLLMSSHLPVSTKTLKVPEY